MRKTPHLRKIQAVLTSRIRSRPSGKQAYAVPSLWLTHVAASRRMPRAGSGKPKRPVKPAPEEFFRGAIHEILRRRPEKIKKGKAGSWTREAVIYNMFVRTTCAFDHDENGNLDLPVDKNGWKETGTFLKAIALLPFIKSFGANTIHLLPITSIGSDGNKGSL